MALKGNNNEEKIWNYLRDKGINAYGTAGLMGNLREESGLRPNNLQNSCEKRLNITDVEYTRLVDDNAYPGFATDKAGYGLAQWTSSNRKQGLLNFVRSRKCSIADLEAQLDYLWYELNNGYKNVLSAIKSATSVRSASDIVLTQFERPKNQSEAVKVNRASYGQEYYNKYASQSGGGTMTVTIGSARIDERGKASGGTTGDQKQTSKPDYSGEVSMQAFYIHKLGWIIIRFKNASHALKFAEAMIRACNNPNIGYDQLGRYGILKVGTGTTTKTECDCSSLIRQCFKEATGVDPGDFTTANAASVLKKTGLVEIVGNYKNGTTLYTGDILNTQSKGHIVAVTNGATRGTTTYNKKSLAEVAQDVKAGKYGNGDARKTALKNAGYTDAEIAEIQAIVNGKSQTLSGSKGVAQSFDKAIAGTYTVSPNVGALAMRDGAGKVGTKVIRSVPKGQPVHNYGYYSTVDGVRWLYVEYAGSTGFMSGRYLKKK